MSTITKYADHADSGVSWLGSLPSHWSVKKLKHTILALESGVSVNASDYPAEREELGVLKTSCVYTGSFRGEENKIVVPEERSRVRCPVRKNAIIISRMNTPDLVGASGFVGMEHPNLFLPDRLWQTVFRYDAAVAPRYVAYFIGTDGFRRQVSLAAEGASSSMQNVAKPDFLAIHLVMPPLAEQVQIARFLDHETARIDALIEKQQQLIALLKEKRQAVISQAVTKGLNSDAPLCASGVEWLGTVPAHWTVGRYKFCTTRVVVGIAEAATHAYADTGTPIIRSTNIKEDGLSQDGLLFIKPWFAEENGSKFLYAGDIVTVRTGYPGVSAVVPPSLDRSQCFTNLIATPNRECEADFLCEYLNSHVGRKYFERLGWGSAQKNISVPILQNIPVVWPSKHEQKEIVLHIREQRLKFSRLECTAESMVSVLQERRTALISAAVSGKIDVRNWSPPKSDAEQEVA